MSTHVGDIIVKNWQMQLNVQFWPIVFVRIVWSFKGHHVMKYAVVSGAVCKVHSSNNRSNETSDLFSLGYLHTKVGKSENAVGM